MLRLRYAVEVSWGPGSAGALPLRAALRAVVALTVVAWTMGCGPRGAEGPGDAAAPRSVAARPVPSPAAAPGEPSAPLSAGAAAGSNLVLITLDTTRADHLGCYGHGAGATPELDALAARGVRFAHAYAPVPMTLPSHATILTGVYPPGHGVRTNGEFRLPPEARTAAEILRERGYQTAAFVACFVLDARFGLDQGFDHYDFTAERTPASHTGGHPERSARSVTEAALRWLRARAADRPFFLWVHYFDPHAPYAPPAEFARRFPGDPYLAEIAVMDTEIGRLLEGLEADGAASRSIVVAIGDHGESRGEHDELFHAATIYQGAVRVPFIVAAPGAVAQGAVIDDAAVSLVDVLPTVLDLLGIADPPAAAATDGRSLCRPDGGPDRIVYLETMDTYLTRGWAPLFGACRAGDKLIRAPRPEYYDLRSDPKELNNLLADASTLSNGARELDRFLDDYLAGKPGPQEVVAAALPMDAETRANLEALGYLTGDPPERSLTEAPDPKDMLPLMHHLRDAKQALAAGRLEQAESDLQALLAKSPRDRAALSMLGQVHLARGRYAEAEQAFRARTEIRSDAVGLAFLANALMLQNRFREAEEALDQAAALEPDNGVVPFARGDLRLMQGRPEEAIALYTRAGEIDPVHFGAKAGQRVQQVRRMMSGG